MSFLRLGLQFGSLVAIGIFTNLLKCFIMPKQTLEKTFHGLQPFKFCGKGGSMLCQIVAQNWLNSIIWWIIKYHAVMAWNGTFCKIV